MKTLPFAVLFGRSLIHTVWYALVASFLCQICQFRGRMTVSVFLLSGLIAFELEMPKLVYGWRRFLELAACLMETDLIVLLEAILLLFQDFFERCSCCYHLSLVQCFSRSWMPLAIFLCNYLSFGTCWWSLTSCQPLTSLLGAQTSPASSSLGCWWCSYCLDFWIVRVLSCYRMLHHCIAAVSVRCSDSCGCLHSSASSIPDGRSKSWDRDHTTQTPFDSPNCLQVPLVDFATSSAAQASNPPSSSPSAPPTAPSWPNSLSDTSLGSTD